jgi:hypothetical protein
MKWAKRAKRAKRADEDQKKTGPWSQKERPYPPIYVVKAGIN